MCIFVVVTVQNRNTNREAVVNNTVDNTNSRLKELARIQKFLFGHPIHGEGKKKKKRLWDSAGIEDDYMLSFMTKILGL